MRLYYLGPPGSFSEEAGKLLFPLKHLAPTESIENVIDAVKKEHSAFGIIPIENSLEGTVIRNFDLLLENHVSVCAEVTLPIEQNLLSPEKKLKDIHTVYSHPLALAQVRHWLKRNLPSVHQEETASTSAAAKHASQEPEAAAIASKSAAQLYKLNILAKNINDCRQNITRFWIVAQKPHQDLPFPSLNTKTACYTIIRDKVGALSDLFNTFAENHISLTSIQSRPLPNAPWRYGFFIDLLVDADDPLAKRMFSKLKKKHPLFKIIGTYPEYGVSNRRALVDYHITRVKKIFTPNILNKRIHTLIQEGTSALFKNQQVPAYLKKILETRFSIMPSVALYKYRHRKKIEDAAREKLLLQKMKKYDILYHLYPKALSISKERIQKKVVLLLKNHLVKETDIVHFKLSELRYYIDHLDSLAIT